MRRVPRPIRLGAFATCIVVTMALVAAGSTAKSAGSATGRPWMDASLKPEQRAELLLSRMTLAEKIGQMTQAERLAVTDDPSQITTLMLGSLLSSAASPPTPNTPEAWADIVDGFQAHALQTRLGIPLVYGVDSVHGHGNLVGATVFPHNIGLGAARDPRLVEQVQEVTAEETRATGPQWVFAPCVCVARDLRWGRTYESFGEDPGLVIKMETAIDGFQGRRASRLASRDRVLATAKHYAGDGDTEFGSGFTIDQGVTVASRREFARIDLAPYVAAVGKHRVGSVMPYYSSVDFTDDGVGNPLKMHAHRELITGVLKHKLGFDGFVISDFDGIRRMPGDYPTKVRTGVNAGIDMFMEPVGYQEFETTLLAEVRAGRVSTARIDDAVRRILIKKFELGLFERPFTDRTNLPEVGSDDHRELARKAVAKSQVLVKNAGKLLPLSGREKVYVAGSNADDIGNQAGGWTVAWQGLSGDIIPGNTILEGIREVAPDARVTYSKDASAPTAGHDVGVVVVGETPYAEGVGDVGGPLWEDDGVPREPKTMRLNAADRAAVDKVCGTIADCVVVVVSGRPMILTDQLGKIDALVAAWLPGSQGEGVADVLFGTRPFTGRLPQTWPRSLDQEPINVGDKDYRPLYPYSWGLRTRARNGSG
jgi:beta-glucosidase